MIALEALRAGRRDAGELLARTRLESARRFAGATHRVVTGMRWTPKQWRFLTVGLTPGLYERLGLDPDLAPDRLTDESELDPDEAWKVSCLGGFGGGKSAVFIARFLLGCALNPIRSGYFGGDDVPESLLCAPTFSDAKSTLLGLLDKILQGDRSIESRRVLSGDPPARIELTNGHVILLGTPRSIPEGASLCQVGLDEVHQDVYSREMENLVGRARDSRAIFRQVISTGLAHRGHAMMLDAQDPDARALPMTRRDGKRFITMLFASDNPHNPSGYAEDVTHFSGGGERDPAGWLKNPDLVFPSWSRDLHLRLPEPFSGWTKEDFQQHPVDVSFDFGTKGAAVVFAHIYETTIWCLLDDGSIGTRRAPAIVVVGQHLPEQEGIESILHDVRHRCLWRIEAGRSKIHLGPEDPHLAVGRIRDLWPGVEVRQHSRGAERLESTRLESCRVALLDAMDRIPGQSGNVRLHVAPWLSSDPSGRGVVEACEGWRITALKDKRLEHVADALTRIALCYCPARPVGSVSSSAGRRERRKRW